MSTDKTAFNWREIRWVKLLATTLGFAICAQLILLGFGRQVGSLHEANWATKWFMNQDGADLAKQMENVFAGYSTFGTGTSGSISYEYASEAPSHLAAQVIVQTMTASKGGHGPSVYKVYNKSKPDWKANDGSGPGTQLIDFPGGMSAKYISGNYGTASTGTNLNWCFVMKNRNWYMKFISTSANSQVSQYKPLTCVNGR